MGDIVHFNFYQSELLHLGAHLEEEHTVHQKITKETRDFLNSALQHSLQFVCNTILRGKCNGASILRVIPENICYYPPLQQYAFKIEKAFGNLKPFEANYDINIKPDSEHIPSRRGYAPSRERDDEKAAYNVTKDGDFISKAKGKVLEYSPKNWQPKRVLMIPSYYHDTLFGVIYFHFDECVDIFEKDITFLYLYADILSFILRFNIS